MLRNKAVSDGTLSFYHNRFVHTWVSKFAYGYFVNSSFNPTDLDHLKRLQNAYICSFSGKQQIKDSFKFSVILPKVCIFSLWLLSVFQCLLRIRKFWRQRSSDNWKSKLKNDFKASHISVSCYWGGIFKPKWKDIDMHKSLISKLRSILTEKNTRKLYSALHTWSWPFSAPGIPSK